ncbi:hypothetical protein [Hominiventricola filiformis]|uniref:Uncharacterized protein n=1 Tax=Hominiventricola filiformis TaxID=2885352 RepID=A0AAE3A808_9FIRM|nr:hypothetical protein [Hominiventricola filiformis]MCC2124830.1 hypothetical protein [Hominiventricola filiformis]
MERLTKWIDDGEKRQAIPDPEIRSNGHGKCCNKLAAPEDLEEQGLLLRLPYRESEEQSEKRSSKMSEAMVDFIRRRFMTRQ